MKSCIDLKARYGERYRITRDPAAIKGGKANPWLWVIPCRYGEIYPYGGDTLAVLVKGTQKAPAIERAIPGLKRHQIGDGEAIFLFDAKLFDEVAEAVGARKRRHLSDSQREQATARLKALRLRKAV